MFKRHAQKQTLQRPALTRPMLRLALPIVPYHVTLRTLERLGDIVLPRRMRP